MTNEARMSKGRSKPKGLPSFGLAYSFVIRRSTFVIAQYLFRFRKTELLLIPVTQECWFQTS